MAVAVFWVAGASCTCGQSCGLIVRCGPQAHAERDTESAGLEAQEGLLPLLKRLIILHSSKLMAVAVFWAAMQQPGAIGWILACE